jgi:hypothetical protein
LSIREESKDDVWGSVKATLDVSVNYLVFQTPTAEISHNNPTFVFSLQKNILRLKITVDYSEILEISESREDLDGESSNETILKPLIVIHFYEFV